MFLLLMISSVIGSTISKSVEYDNNQIIQYVNGMNTSWKAGHNFDELNPARVSHLLGLKLSENRLRTKEVHLLGDSEVPEKFDAREQWPNCPTIGSISDQGNCGSCWAVASADTFSDRLCVISEGNFSLPLSAQELVSCCDDCGDGCQGGYNDKAWQYFENVGLSTGGEWESNIGCQPYNMQSCEHIKTNNSSLKSCSKIPIEDTPHCKRECTNPSYINTFYDDHHRAFEGYMLKGEQNIQKEILNYGPVTAAMVVYEDFINYKSGVYQYTTGKSLGYHAVRIIGWGTEDGKPYWLVANSWNTHWGDKGFFKIIRGSNNCIIEESVTAGVPYWSEI